MTNISVVTLRDLWEKNIDGYAPILLDVYNPDIGWSDNDKELYKQDNAHLRLISDENKVVYKGKTYLPCAFDYNAPEVDGKKIGQASITISALDARVKKLLRTIKTLSEVSIVAMFAKSTRDTTGATIYKFSEMKNITFYMSTANSNRATATFNLAFDNALSQNVPFDIATQERVPGTSA